MFSGLKTRLDGFVWGDALYRYGLPGRVGAGVLRNLYAVVRDIVSGQLTLRSMSLVYTTLLSIVPLIAFSFSVLKGLGYHKQAEPHLYRLLEPLGDKGVEITDQVMTLVNNINGSVLGGIGLAFFIYTAISMVQKVEEAFNYVWYVTKPRSFAKRFVEYVAVLVIGTLAISIALGTIASISDDGLFIWMQQNRFIGPIFIATSRMTPYLVVIGLFTFLYMFMPNTTVRLRSALIGGVAGGVIWATAGVLFTAFVVTGVRTQTVYASFAIAIITLIWLYLSWLILLIGSQIAFYFQNPAYLRIGRRDPRLSNGMRERLALNIMLSVGAAFRDSGRSIDLARLSEELRIPSPTIEPILGGLERSGLLMATEDEYLVPGRDMSGIRLRDVLDVVRSRGETGSHCEPQWAAE
ncbi:MAG: YihY/virulence factor BrkB family protein, partial [Gammaproteobacteria bacterium]|nr:YihY/virulence factor BrkB family protein [Gammaproteobacteria bacterium]